VHTHTREGQIIQDENKKSIPLLGWVVRFVVSQDCVVYLYTPLRNLYNTQD